MQSLGLKFGGVGGAAGGGGRREDWRCCFCCHVRTGTIFLGIWHLMLHVLAMAAMVVMLCRPELMVSLDGPTLLVGPHRHQVGMSGPGPVIPTSPSEVDVETMSSDFQLSIGQSPSAEGDGEGPGAQRPQPYRHRHFTYHDLNVGAVVSFCTFSITALMVIGAIRGRPMYLMPFLCLQVFDFCIASLSAIGYVCYLPDVHRLVEQWPRAPFQSQLLQMSPQCLSLLVLFSFMVAMLVKAYFIGVVWSCYRYLSLRLLASQRTVHYIDPDIQTLLPDYDTAVKKFPAPPPSYASATASTAVTLVPPTPPGLSPPPYPAVVVNTEGATASAVPSVAQPPASAAY